MKLTAWRVAAFLLLIAVSIGFGFGFDAAATALEKQRYPRPERLSASVSAVAAEYGLPEDILWATLSCGSNFTGDAVSSDGRIGLMQLTPEQFAFISEELLGKSDSDAGLLYDPQTNLRCGAAWLSYLYEHYGVWRTVFAAYRTDTATVDAWLADADLTDEAGRLTEIPDKTTASYVTSMEKTLSMYRKLYYQI